MVRSKTKLGKWAVERRKKSWIASRWVTREFVDQKNQLQTRHPFVKQKRNTTKSNQTAGRPAGQPASQVNDDQIELSAIKANGPTCKWRKNRDWFEVPKWREASVRLTEGAKCWKMAKSNRSRCVQTGEDKKKEVRRKGRRAEEWEWAVKVDWNHEDKSRRTGRRGGWWWWNQSKLNTRKKKNTPRNAFSKKETSLFNRKMIKA